MKINRMRVSKKEKNYRSVSLFCSMMVQFATVGVPRRK
jgi:hypothetical protein